MYLLQYVLSGEIDMSKIKNHACKALPSLVRRLFRRKATQHDTCSLPGTDGRGSTHGFERILCRSSQRGQVLIKATLMVAVLGGVFGLAVRTPRAETVAPPDPLTDFASLKSIPVPGPSPEVLAQFVLN